MAPTNMLRVFHFLAVVVVTLLNGHCAFGCYDLKSI